MKHLIVVFILFISCSPKQSAVTPMVDYSASVKSLLNKQWLEEDVIVLQDPDTIEHNITFQFPAPERDDVLMLFDNGTYQYDESATKHDQTNKQVFVQGNWKIDELKKQLFLTANGSTNLYDILEMSDSTLVLKLAVKQHTKSYAYRLSFTCAK